MSDLRLCFQSRFTFRACDKCGKDARPVHLPGRHVGYFCSKCCPVCSKPQAPETKEA